MKFFKKSAVVLFCGSLFSIALASPYQMKQAVPGMTGASSGGSPVSALFSYSGAVQLYAVPSTGTYNLTVIGAKGCAALGRGFVGGYGAKQTCVVSLTKDDQLAIVVGGVGVDSTYGGGGGGGSYVAKVVAGVYTPLCVAGGGGGAGYSYSGQNSSAVGGTGDYGTGVMACSLGYFTGYGGGGVSLAARTMTQWGQSLPNGSAAGTGGMASGGFGGGGAAFAGGGGGGGGGGGYTGGNGGCALNTPVAQAGTSYSLGATGQLTAAFNNGVGSVQLSQ